MIIYNRIKYVFIYILIWDKPNYIIQVSIEFIYNITYKHNTQNI